MSRALTAAMALLALATLTAPTGARAAEPEPASWKTVKADHFIVHHLNDETFAREMARKADAEYTRIAEDLGYRRHSNFWMWENRVRIYIHPDEKSLQKVPGTREWSQAVSIYELKEIHCVSGQPDLLDGVLPHEITHLIFRDFVGMSSEIPLWMDEGVAQWEEPARRELAKRYVRDLLKADDALPLEEIFATSLRSIGHGKRVEKFYVQSVSLVDFLIARHGGTKFTDFCRRLRDGHPLAEALRKTYPSIATPEALEAEWRAYAASI